MINKDNVIKVTCFGELLLRLSTTQDNTLLQSSSLDMFVGGAEANVAVNLACLGCDCTMISALPENTLASYLKQELQKYQVKTESIVTCKGRLGQYVLETGASYFQSEVIYDREHTSFIYCQASEYNWPEILKNTTLFHFSGINLALGDNVIESALTGAKKAKKQGALVSFDSNFRASLWQNNTEKAAKLMDQSLQLSDIAFMTEQDINILFDLALTSNSEQENRLMACKIAFKKYPNLKWIASTFRQYDDNGTLFYQGAFYSRDDVVYSKRYKITTVIDRVGTGDAFAAGILYALNHKHNMQYSVDFAIALATLKHSIKGDFAAVSVEKVESVIKNRWMNIKR